MENVPLVKQASIPTTPENAEPCHQTVSMPTNQEHATTVKLDFMSTVVETALLYLHTASMLMLKEDVP